MVDLVPSTTTGTNPVTQVNKQNIQAAGLNVTFELHWYSTTNVSDSFVIEVFREDNDARIIHENVPGNERTVTLAITKPEPGAFRVRLKISTIENGGPTTSYVIIEDIVK